MLDQSKKKIRSLDVSGSEGPEAVLHVMSEASKLGEGEVLEVTLSCIPFQLYDLLQQRGYLICYANEKNGKVCGVVRRRPGEAIK
jgi:TusA-related sulfurtransferase